MSKSASIGYFITDHGFGHASRAAAVMAAVGRLQPAVRFELFTTCPKWIFEDSLQAPFGYHAVHGDVGLVQASPLREDMAATLDVLQRRFPFSPNLTSQVAATLNATGCRLALCDIAPLGIAAAAKAGIPSMLVENFTWDWIYQPYLSSEPRLEPYIEYLHDLYARVDHHIQTDPLCRPMAGTARVGPIARLPRTAPEIIRNRLNIADTARVVMVSMGGVPDRFEFLDNMNEEPDVYMLIPGAEARRSAHPKIILLPAHSDFFHPDLLQAADVLVGKAGYSTAAEAYFAGIAFGYVQRPRFAESQVLENFIESHLPSRCIKPDDYHDGRWIERLPELLAMPRSKPALHNGAEAVSRAVLDLIGN